MPAESRWRARCSEAVNKADGEPGLDLEAGFLPDFAAETFDDGLAALEDAARRLPQAVLASLHQQHSLLIVDDDASDADGVWVGSGHRREHRNAIKVPREVVMLEVQETIAASDRHAFRYEVPMS